MTESKRVALALGSGGARGYAHIGVIEELERRGFDITGVAGSSMGALVGGLYAAGKLDDFTEWACSLTQFDVIRLLDPSILELGTIRAEKILDRIREILGDITIEELPISYIAIATDLGAGRSVWFLRGPVDAAIRASIAIPGVIAPAIEHGRVLADGGILDPLPIVATAGFRSDLTVGVNLSTAPTDDDWAPVKAEATDTGAFEEWFGWIRRGAEQLSAPMNSMIARFGAGSDDRQAEDVSVEPVDDTEAADEHEDELVAPKLGRFDTMNRSLDIMQAALARYHRAGHPPDILIEIPRTACRVLDFHRASEMIQVGRDCAASALDAAGFPAPAEPEEARQEVSQ